MARNANKTHDQDLSVGERIGLFITGLVGNMWAALFFGLLTLVSLPAVVQADSPIVWISWITQTFLQLVLLPIILVGQNAQSKHAEKLAQSMYDADIDAEQRIIEVQEYLARMESEKLDEIIKLLTKKK